MSSSFYIIIIVLTIVILLFIEKSCANNKECYFFYTRTTDYETQQRARFSLVTRECFGDLIPFRELFVKYGAKTNKKLKWGLETKTLKGDLYGVETFLDLILARGQGLFDWRSAPTQKFIFRQQWHINELAKKSNPQQQQQRDKFQEYSALVQQAKDAKFDLDQFLDNNFVCRRHLNELLNTWAESHTHFKAIFESIKDVRYYCAFPIDANGFGKTPEDPHHLRIKGEPYFLQKNEAKYVLEKHGMLMHLGIPVCEWHLNAIKAGMAAATQAASNSKAIAENKSKPTKSSNKIKTTKDSNKTKTTKDSNKTKTTKDSKKPFVPDFDSDAEPMERSTQHSSDAYHGIDEEVLKTYMERMNFGIDDDQQQIVGNSSKQRPTVAEADDGKNEVLSSSDEEKANSSDDSSLSLSTTSDEISDHDDVDEEIVQQTSLRKFNRQRAQKKP